MKQVVCFDIGGTNVKYAIVDIDEQISEKGAFVTTKNDGQSVLDNMCSIITDYQQRFNVIGITISSPGFVNTKSGVIESGNIIDGFNGLNIKKYFEEKYELPVTVENDANCATIAEHRLGNGKGYENVVCVTVGTGVGGGIIINNQIYNGNKFMAGEFGFMFIHGIHSQMPEDDILSNYASTRSLIEKTSADLAQEVDGITIFKEADAGNQVCQKNIDNFYNSLAMGIYNICYILNPDKVLIGGAISQQENLISEIKDRLHRLTPSFSNSLVDVVEIDRCKFLNDAGIMGSYCNFMNQYRGEI